MENITREELLQVAQATIAPKESIHNEPFVVTADEVLAAIVVADSISQSYQKQR